MMLDIISKDKILSNEIISEILVKQLCCLQVVLGEVRGRPVPKKKMKPKRRGRDDAERRFGGPRAR